MQTTSRRTTYLSLCILGFVLPYTQFIPWLIANGLDVRLFLHELFANRISRFFALDVIVSALVLFVWVSGEKPHSNRRHLWAPIVGTLLVGVSFGLPLWLYLREAPSLPDSNKARAG